MDNSDEWVLVRRPAEKDIWSPSATNLAGSSKPLKLAFAGPAKFWTDAIPVGNGRLGAMVWGGVASELIQLNGISKCRFLFSWNMQVTFEVAAGFDLILILI